MAEQTENMTQKNRLAYIDFRLEFLGTISRNDLIDRFGIKEAAATRDFSAYREMAPDNMEYDPKIKLYSRCEGFKPLFPFSSDQVLSMLAYGFGNDFFGSHEPFITCDTPKYLNTPDLSVLSVLTRAIYQSRIVKMKYSSVQSGESSREIAPFAIVNNGLRWHVRGYDRMKSTFWDFVITRISKPKITNEKPHKHEKPTEDIQWNRIVELQIVPHPHLEHPKSVEADYDMENGVLHVKLRAAVAGYFLRIWNIDCTDDHSLRSKPEEPPENYHIQLWLQNPKALYGVETAGIAPGYKEEKN